MCRFNFHDHQSKNSRERKASTEIWDGTKVSEKRRQMGIAASLGSAAFEKCKQFWSKIGYEGETPIIKRDR